MIEDELHNQELNRHREQVDHNIERHQALNLQEKQRAIAAANQNSVVARIVNIAFFLFGALELLLVVRVVLQLVAANPNNGFADFVYDLSAPFVSLFANLLQNPTVGDTGVLEVTTIIAMLVWAIVTWLVGQVIWLLLSRPR